MELGKQQALALAPLLTAAEDPAPQDDSSTDALIRWYRAHR
ncbi:glucose-6-phosphate isomerase [Mycobacteroides abscessus subsp. abscessus]|nr:glucose-6-phosphate isomerase [Mycobacteroides abscessus subsp. abscessus]